jgi:hypothetical protein
MLGATIAPCLNRIVKIPLPSRGFPVADSLAEVPY